MKCPYCEKEMIQGTFGTSRVGLVWFPDTLANPDYYTDRELPKAGGIVLQPRGLHLSCEPVTAHVCHACGKGIFSFEPER